MINHISYNNSIFIKLSIKIESYTYTFEQNAIEKIDELMNTYCDKCLLKTH